MLVSMIPVSQLSPEDIFELVPRDDDSSEEEWESHI
jgi:hypothetical protein